MTTEKYNEIYNKYKGWIGLPVELFMYSTLLGKRTYKKFLLKDISCFAMEEENEKESITTSVIVQDLETNRDHQINLSEFDKIVRLIQLGTAPTVKITNNEKSANIIVDNSLEYIEVFIIQINSHFGKKVEDWIKVAGNLYIDFNSKRTNQNPSVIPDRIYLSSLISNQVQPVFNISKKYPIGNPNTTSSINFYDTIEIVAAELSQINEDYEITIVYNKYPLNNN